MTTLNSRIYDALLDQEANDYMTGARSWRADIRPACAPYNELWNRAGVEKLVAEAAARFEEKTGIRLPYNFATHGPWVEFRKSGQHFDRRDEMVSTAARVAGWLDAVAEDGGGRFPNITDLILKTQSRNGAYSPHTTCRLMEIIMSWPNPGRLNSKIATIKYQADKILRPTGLYASWEALGRALEGGSHVTGKAALRAALGTLDPQGAWVRGHSKVRKKMTRILKSERQKALKIGDVWMIVEQREEFCGYEMVLGVECDPRAKGPQLRDRIARLVGPDGQSWIYHWSQAEAWFGSEERKKKTLVYQARYLITAARSAEDREIHDEGAVSALVTKAEIKRMTGMDPDPIFQNSDSEGEWYMKEVTAVKKGGYEGARAAHLARREIMEDRRKTFFREGRRGAPIDW